MPDQPQLVAGQAKDEDTITDRYGSIAAKRAIEIIANVQVAHANLRGAHTPAEMRARSNHLMIIMQSVARAAVNASPEHRDAIREFADMRGETGIVRMVDEPSLLNLE